MGYLEEVEKLNPLAEALEKLEEQAGITEAIERAKEGRFIPLGIDGEKVSSDEYFADELAAGPKRWMSATNAVDRFVCLEPGSGLAASPGSPWVHGCVIASRESGGGSVLWPHSHLLMR